VVVVLIAPQFSVTTTAAKGSGVILVRMSAFLLLLRSSRAVQCAAKVMNLKGNKCRALVVVNFKGKER
jgi:hypothetical protein